MKSRIKSSKSTLAVKAPEPTNKNEKKPEASKKIIGKKPDPPKKPTIENKSKKNIETTEAQETVKKEMKGLAGGIKLGGSIKSKLASLKKPSETTEKTPTKELPIA